jgi:hypothetical protein
MTAVVISESSIRLGTPATEPFAVVAAAKAEAGRAERIEPAMLKGVFPAPYQPVTVTTAFFKSLPTIVLPIISLSAIVLPTVAFTAIVLPIIAVTVAPSPVLSEGD